MIQTTITSCENLNGQATTESSNPMQCLLSGRESNELTSTQNEHTPAHACNLVADCSVYKITYSGFDNVTPCDINTHDATIYT